MQPIYIVDDDKSFGISLKRLLKAEGFSADYFVSALSFLQSVPPGQEGCAIVDIHMPDCDGFNLIEKMNALHYKMHVIVITGRAQADDTDTALQKGVVGFLQKPFGVESLLVLLKKAEGDF